MPSSTCSVGRDAGDELAPGRAPDRLRRGRRGKQGFLKGSRQTAKCRPGPASPLDIPGCRWRAGPALRLLSASKPHTIDREHIGSIEEIRDAAEPFGLALRAIGRTRSGRAPSAWCWRRGSSRVSIRRRERTPGRIWRALSAEGRSSHQVWRRAPQRLAVEAERRQREFVAVQFKLPRQTRPCRMRPQRQRRDDAGDASIERNVEIDRIGIRKSGTR